MDIELMSRPEGRKAELWKSFLDAEGLHAENDAEFTVLIRDGGRIVAAGSRSGSILKYIAVSSDHRGEDLTAALLTRLRQNAFACGKEHLFLYTKPENEMLFSSLLFFPIAKTDDVLLMESEPNGIGRFLDGLASPKCAGEIGAVVMNCDPFTLGHRYLIETAAGECGFLHIFVLSEDKSAFSAADRLEMVRAGSADLKNAAVHETGPYLISSATFPTYFLKDRDGADEIHCLLDIKIFLERFVPALSITRRYVGTEPLSPLTDRYNRMLKAHCAAAGVELVELPRLENGEGPISAGKARRLIQSGDTSGLGALLPHSTLSHLKALGLV